VKADNATRLLNDLQQLIDRWALELDAKPLWWRRHSATGSGAAAGLLTVESPKEVQVQHPSPRKNATRSKTPPDQRARGRAKNGRVSRANSAAGTRS
jgi:hypothetical protein